VKLADEAWGETMRRGLICLLALLGVHSAAWARPVFEMSPDMTTKQVMDACGSDDPSQRAESCDQIFVALFTTAHDTGGFCLPDPSEATGPFRARIMAWLRDHPEDQSLPFISDGSRLAAIGVYACK
jgi:hypothetical protein